MPLQSIAQFPYVKGIVASNQPLALPKGALQRGSNILMTSRGAASPCDGSGVIYAFENTIQTDSGKILAEKLFAPTGVTPYYMMLKQALELHLGPPQNLAGSAGGGGGMLPTATYFYKVTAIDGLGGETTGSNEVSVAVTLGQFVTLTWNIVPNAFAYNVYRSTSSGTEILLATLGNLALVPAVNLLPVLQPAAGSLTVTFEDNGTAVAQPATSVAIVSITESNVGVSATIILAAPITLAPFQLFDITGNSEPSFNHNNLSTVSGVPNLSTFVFSVAAPVNVVGTGGNLLYGGITVPVTDTSSQTALFVLPPGSSTSYDDSDIVALFPSTESALNSPPAGGSGGGGGIGPGILGSASSTPNGGLPGLVSLLPQFKQFTNRMAIALGNGFRPQLYSDDTGTAVNPATFATIATVTVDAFGVVTITLATNHNIDPAQGIGANVILAGVGVSVYDGVFTVIAVPTATTLKVRNLAAIGAGASSLGLLTVTTIPLISTFIPAYPEWAASTVLSTGDLIVPATQPSAAIYLTVIQGGETGTVEPTWPTGGTASIGQHVFDGTVIYSVTGLLNSAAPAPPGASHIEVFSGALWVFNTAPNNTANGLDGPCSLRQSSINNPNSWNPVNQAFLDKDDGSEGMSLAKFTITAQGIPPEGSLIAFKNYSPYQIIGVFGAPNLQIQAVSSNMGCIAPRTTLFVPGFGIMRMTHLGIATFGGVKDEITSEQIRPYLFPTRGKSFSDIVVIDANWVAVSWAALTANPPMYCMATPIGNSNAQLTRVFTYDLVLKGWDPVDLFFPISSMEQVQSEVSNPLTILGGFSDGALQRWQAGDVFWYTGGGSHEHGVDWSFRTLTVASNDTDQRVYVRRLVVTGTNSGPRGNISVQINQSGVGQFELTFSIAPDADFDIDVPVQLTGKRFDAIVYSGGGGGGSTVPPAVQAEIDGLAWESEARPAGVVVGV